MRKFLLSASSFILACSAFGGDASAQTSRIYFAGYLGLSSFNDQEFSAISPTTNGDIQVDNAVTFAGAMGLRLSRNLRIEAELSYRNANNDRIEYGSGGGELGGELSSWIGMATAYYDFDVKLPWNLEPYVGAGIGYGFFQGDFNDQTGGIAPVSNEDYAILWNVAGGVKYRPRSDLAYTMGYRYIDSADLDFGNIDLDYSSHEFRIGLEYDLPVQY